MNTSTRSVKAEASIPAAVVPHVNSLTAAVDRSPAPGICAGYRNQILANLTPAQLQQLQPHLTRVWLKQGKVLSDVGAAATHVYLPEDCVIAILVPMRSGASPHVCMVGYEGMTDSSVALGRETATARYVVLVSGEAVRMPTSFLRSALVECGALRNSVYAYCSLLLGQSLQSAGCHALHSAQARLARLLLMLTERVSDGTTLHLTQETLASLLGLQRTTVTTAADALQRLGIMTVHRGNLTILDRAGLANLACECHAATRLRPN